MSDIRLFLHLLTSRIAPLLRLSVLALVLPAQAVVTTYSTPGTSTFTVPAGVTSIVVSLWGAGGGGGGRDAGYTGGVGGSGQYVSGTLAVTPGDVLSIQVGGAGGGCGGTQWGNTGCGSQGDTSGNGHGGGNGTVQLNYIVCLPPSNTPSRVTLNCVCDIFARSSLNPSTIFASDWAVSNSDGLGSPYINSSTGLLRLTENTGNNAKLAVAPALFPGSGNYLSVEFNHYAYNGNGADGIRAVGKAIAVLQRLSENVITLVPRKTRAAATRPGL